MTDLSTEEIDLPSRAQLKRENQELRDMGEQLVLLAKSQLEKITLDDSLKAAIKEARRLKNLDARRRQLQYIGKLLRNIDVTDIKQSLEKLNHQSQTFRQHFAKLEEWRDRFISEGNDAIEDFIAQYPQADRQQLRNLQRQACREKSQNKPSTASEKLFKYIRQLAD
ncbi:MAG: ribosome biogenesis factor YjgA [Porticoccaceae bacterium]|jgi:ribosome-associated protein